MNLSIKEYLLRIRKTVDALASTGDPSPLSHHVDVIFEGLPSDFSLVMSIIESKFGLMDLDEVEVLLLAHEIRLEKFKKQTLGDAASLNLTHTSPSQSLSVTSESNSTQTKPNRSPVMEPDYNSFRGGGRFSRCGRGGRGRGVCNSNLQCQVCYKFSQLLSPACTGSIINIKLRLLETLTMRSLVQ